jgi:hypothetical protein
MTATAGRRREQVVTKVWWLKDCDSRAAEATRRDFRSRSPSSSPSLRPGLVTHAQFLAGLAQLAQQLFHRVQRVGDHAVALTSPSRPNSAMATAMSSAWTSRSIWSTSLLIVLWCAWVAHYLVRPAAAQRRSPNMRISFVRSSPRFKCDQHTTPFSISRAVPPACSRKLDRSHKV